MPAPRTDRAGFSLVELLVTLVVLSLIMGTTVLFFQGQSKAFRNGTDKMDLLQNARYTVSQIERILRTMGAGVTGEQPMLVYGANTVVAFNTDYVEVDTTDFRWAVNWNPSVGAPETLAWPAGWATVIPNSSPSYTYPPTTYLLGNGTIGPAETKIFWFAPDSTTSRADDYVLYERTNSGTQEYVARNLLAYPGRPFFEYFLARRTASGDTVITATGSLLPLARRTPVPADTPADSAAKIRPDSVRMIRINVRVTNGQTGSAERTRDFSQMIQVPNNGLSAANVCGRTPFSPATFTATPDTAVGSGIVHLTWTRSADHGGGEFDVRQYIVFRRDDTATVWRNPLMMIEADTALSYSVPVGGLVPGEAYDFGVVAQDCTPSQSTLLQLTRTAP